MTHIWFAQWGWIYRPVSLLGWLASILSVAFCVQVFVAVDRHSHSVSDTLYAVFPYFVSSFLLLNWLASRTSRHARVT